ncbi:putative lipoprotein YerB precursor [compost metagenome]
MNLNLSKIGIPLMLAACLTLLSACGGNKSTLPEANPTENVIVENETTEPIDEPAPPAYTSPLSGKPLDEPITKRPLAVMINNAPAARPQSGLNGADIVYEVLAEGGITRFIAIFHSGEEGAKIGPVRSIRPYMIDIGESYHGVLVHAGASNDAFAIIQRQHKEDLDEITNAGAYFWRDKSRKAPHNLYSNVEKLTEGALKRNYDMEDTNVPAYTFRSEDDSVEGAAANSVEVKFQLSNYLVTYEYDAETKLYKRFINGKPHNDLDTGEPITATNVVILGADHKVLDDVGRIEVNLEIGGKAVLLQRGKMIEGQWVRKSNDVIRFVKDNEEIPFYPGTTYFNIVPNQPDFDSHIKVE